jgi:hypothetical protein
MGGGESRRRAPACKAGRVHDVDSALDLLRGRDLASGRQVSAAWQGLSGGDARYRASQFDVQRYLWLILPRLVRAGDAADWRAVTEAFAVFFDLTGEPRYAAICRGGWTERILATADDEDRCAELAINAMDDSGVLPPEELDIAWLPDPGPYEAAAFDAIARALESAIEDGQIPLATPATDTLRLVLAIDLLNSRLTDETRRTVVQAMIGERLRYWSRETPSPALRELLVRTEPDIATPPLADDAMAAEASGALGPLRLLLESCADGGIRLTKAGYLPTDLVARLVEAMPSGRTFPGRGRSESNWPPVGQLRELAHRCDLVDLIDGRMRLTYDGESAIEDDQTLFSAVFTQLIGTAEPGYRQHVLETVLTMMLLEERIDRAAIDRRIAVVLDECGWRQEEDQPLPHEEVQRLRVEALWDLRVLGALSADDVERPVGLNAFGRELALSAMRARVMQGWWFG